MGSEERHRIGRVDQHRDAQAPARGPDRIQARVVNGHHAPGTIGDGQPEVLEDFQSGHARRLRAFEHLDVIGREGRLVDAAEVEVGEYDQPARRRIVISRHHAIELRAEAAAQVHRPLHAKIVHGLQQRRRVDARRPMGVDVRRGELRLLHAGLARDERGRGVVGLQRGVADEDRGPHWRILLALLRQRPARRPADRGADHQQPEHRRYQSGPVRSLDGRGAPGHSITRCADGPVTASRSMEVGIHA